MSAPLYFFPGLELSVLLPGDKLASGVLERYGLAGTLGDLSAGQITRQDIRGKGPGERSGAMIVSNTAGQPPLRAGYFPDFQAWQKVRNEPELWIGIDNEHRPTPADLARKQRVPGVMVELADGEQYETPIVRSIRGSQLPQDLYRDASGEVITEIKPQWQWLWDLSGEVWDLLYNENSDGKMPFSRVLDLCVAFVGVNYRVGQAEQMVLRLIDTSEAVWGGVFRAVTDDAFLSETLAAQKKSETPPGPATMSSSPGGGD